MKLKLVIVFSFLAFIASGQKVILNKNYVKSDEITQIAYTPYFLNNEIRKDINDVFYETFSKTFKIADTSLIINNILSNYKFNEIIGKTAYKDFDINELKNNPNLYSELTSENIEIYKEKTLHSDILVIGSQLHSRIVTKVSGNGNITFSGEIVVFDLRTGEFIISISDKVKVKFDNTSYNEILIIKSLFENFCILLKDNLE